MVAGVYNVNRTITVDANTVGTQQAAFGNLHTLAKNTDQSGLVRIVKTYARVLVIGNDHLVIVINGDVFG